LKVKFSNLSLQFREISKSINEVAEVLESGNYVSGANVIRFEENFAAFSESKFAIGVNSGTSAGDEVLVPSHTFIATINSVLLVGAIPVFVDVDSNGLLDLIDLKKKITKKSVGVIPVHLYGSTVSEELMNFCKSVPLKIIEDASQSHGAKYPSGKQVGFYGDLTAYSLYPGKNLGAAGEAGIITTNDFNLDSKSRLIRNWGSSNKYSHEIFGLNYRMDEIQAVILLNKLDHLPDWNIERRRLANIYMGQLKNIEVVNSLVGTPVYHQFVIRTEKRAELINWLNSNEIETGIHYPIPCHLQPFICEQFPGISKLEITEKLAKEVLSLPLYPGLKDIEVEYVSKKINEFFSA
jgi:dTDP-4-amino-4,6-dideoxygalactose transaminase